MTETRALDTTEPLLPETDLVPLAWVAIELGESIDYAEGRFGDSVQLDDCGLRALPAAVVRQYFAERAEWKARHEEERENRRAARPPRPASRGIPASEAPPGTTALEVMMGFDRE